MTSSATPPPVKTGAARRSPRRKTPASPQSASLQPVTRKQPVQTRSKFTVKSIIDAAHELLVKQGIDAVTTRQVAGRAGVAIGTLYQYFPNRDAILIRLAYMIMDEEVSETMHQLGKAYYHSLEEYMACLLERSLDVERRMLGLGHDFYRRHARYLSFGRHLRSKSSTQPQNPGTMMSAMDRILSDHGKEIEETDRELAAFMLVRGIRSLVITLVEQRPELLGSPALGPMLTRIAMAVVAGGNLPAVPGEKE